MGSVAVLKRPGGLPDTWSDDALFTAVRAHVFGASPEEVGAILNDTPMRVAHWTRSPQWQQLTRLVLPDVRDLLATQLYRIGNKTLAQLDQRLDEGDPVIQIDGTPKMDEDGNPVHRPLRAKDLAAIAKDIMTERRAMEAKQTGGEDDSDEVISIRALAAALKDAGEKKLRIIDAEPM